MRALLVGATAGVGRALADALARRGDALHLVSSDRRDLDALTADLRLRFGARVSASAVDLVKLDPATLRREALESLGGLDALFYIAGLSLIERDPESLSDEDVESLIAVNFSSAVRLINVFLPDLEAAATPCLVAVGSAAQARPRGRNTVYAAAKTGLEFYFEGLRHRLAARSGSVRFYRVGYVDTQMTFGQTLLLPKASPESVAAAIVAGLGRDAGPKYVPCWWGLLARVYRSIPWPIFRRMGSRA